MEEERGGGGSGCSESFLHLRREEVECRFAGGIEWMDRDETRDRKLFIYLLVIH